MFKKIGLSLLVTASISSLTGCASIVNGTRQDVNVHTGEVHGATCSIRNDKGQWVVDKTPGTAVVHRSYKDLKIDCSKPGYHRSFKQVTSKTKSMAFGNLVFGGPIGAGVDIANGSAYDYPSEVYVPMTKRQKV